MTTTAPAHPFPSEGIKRTQKFSRAGCSYLHNIRNSLSGTTNKHLASVWNRRKDGHVACELSVVYKLKRNAIADLGFGRLYGSAGSLERLEKECRGVLCKDFYYDVDIVNCHPVLLVQFARNRYSIDLPELEKYVNDRDSYLANISPNREEAKTAIIKILYGGKAETPFLEPIAKEIRNFTKMLCSREEYSELLAACKIHKELGEWEKKNVTGIYGTFLSYLLQTEERNCMLSMVDSLEEDGWSVDIFCYDGVMVQIRNNVYLEDALVKCEARVLANTGYVVKLVNKPLITFAEYEASRTSTENYKGVPLNEYLNMKREFEMTNFYYAPTDEYCEYEMGKPPLHMSAKHANAYYSAKWLFKKSDRIDDYTLFWDLWKVDPKRRIIKTISLSPSTDPEVFTIPLQLQYQKGEAAASDVPAFFELVNIVCSHKQPLIDYTLNWLAHLLQHPFDLPGVGLIFTGEKGVGKDTLMDFFMEHVIGRQYSFNYINTKMFFEKHDCNIMNKFLVKLEEADTKICIENANELKGRFTAKELVFNPKNAKSIKAENFTRIVMTTNGTCPVETANGERRFVVIPCSSEKKGDLEYWKKIRNTMFHDTYGHAVAQMLLDRDITDFEVRKLPENDYQNEIIESRKSSEERFIEAWDGEECLASDLYRKYKDFCFQNDLPFIDNLFSFGKALVKFLRNGLQHRRASTGVFYKK